MEFREEDDDGDGAGCPPAPASAALHHHSTTTATRPAPVGTPALEPRRPQTQQQYHECLRNHAAAAGGHVVDGCCEFMAASPDDPLACAACGCHRSFHRRGDTTHLPLLAAANNNTRAAPPLLLPAGNSKHQQRLAPFLPYGLAPSAGATTTESSSEERRGQAPRRRSRTTFTREQKEQMLAFAERVGWRMQRQDEASVERFCAEAGVRRQALKVWMHNNKQSSSTGRRQLQKPSGA